MPFALLIHDCVCVTDLMLPGVVGREKGGRTLEGLEKGQSCAVALVGNRY